MKPITRIDMYLAVISGDEDAITPLPAPVTRIDMYLAHLAGEEVAELPEPVTRIDCYLAALCGMDVVLPDEPLTRIDFYLAALNGETVDTPEAITRIDYYLNNWSGGGGLPWETFVGNPLQFTAPKAHALRTTMVEFAPKQAGSGDPSPDNVRPISGRDSVSVWNETDYDPTAQPMTTLTFPTTVYGGTAQVAEDGSGVGSEEWYFAKMSDFNWTRYSDYFRTGATVGSKGGEVICSRYKSVAGTDKSIGMSSSSTRIIVRDSDYSTADEFVSSFTDEDTVCIKRETPVPFTPTASSTPTAVAGINTMWTDGDSLTVEARGEAVNLNALQSLNMLLGGRYVNNHGADEPTDEEALNIILGGNER